MVSKRVSDYIGRLQNTKSEQVVRRLTKGQNADGSPSPKSKVPDKWLSLVSAPFKCSATCCDVMKKRPIKAYSKQSGRHAGFIGTMTEESVVRKQEYINHGCNGFDLKYPLSSPLSFWNESDIWEYIRLNRLSYSKIYDMGEERTGCMF
ncbi:phosphoadenosine phosphosulfate reductase family protein, partial [Pseudomonas aeruginosa]|nr:phosphoadenosine phosphosulfate reductase family protein [Pseudomonas aeruginosa]